MAMRDIRTTLAAGFILTLTACGGGGSGSGASGGDGSGDGDEVALKADISTATNVTAGEALSFDGGGSSGDGLSYRWAFGDGGNGGGERIAHVFTQPGTYDVMLTVVNADGDRDATSVTVTVDPGPDPDATDGVLNGVVTDTGGASIEGVTVELIGGGASGSTDANGAVTLSGLGTGIDLVLRLTASGYAEQFVRTRIPAGTDEGRFEATLITREDAGTVSADTGGKVSGSDGTAIDVPPNALVDGNGDPVGGSVDVALTPVDTSDDDEFAAFPGSFGAIERDGDEVRLATLGVAEFLLEQGGEELQLAPGATAELTIPLYATQLDGNTLAAGDTIPFWSLDEATGEWVREGTGTVISSGDSPTGLAFTLTVSHLSWWNCDIAVDPANVVPAFSLASGGSFNDG
ncbi:MAG: PKD domain-containing protein [Halofilum sp. (in: g-proteobacteria)]|nr:PKD domain-containing protein [Halofilum sp. (in: g-proteobacteria)]